MSTYDGPIFDADNHLYETGDALTRYLPKEYEGFVKYVEVDGRTKIAINNRIYESIPNPTFEVVAPPGSFADYFSGKNPEGKTLREMAGTPMRSIDAFRSAGPRLALLDETRRRRRPDVPHPGQPGRGQPPRRPRNDLHRHPRLQPVAVRRVAVRLQAADLRHAGGQPVHPRARDRRARLGPRARRQGRAAPARRGRRHPGHPVPVPPGLRRLLARGSRSPASWWPCTHPTPATSATPTSGRARAGT